MNFLRASFCTRSGQGAEASGSSNFPVFLNCLNNLSQVMMSLLIGGFSARGFKRIPLLFGAYPTEPDLALPLLGFLCQYLIAYILVSSLCFFASGMI